MLTLQNRDQPLDTCHDAEADQREQKQEGQGLAGGDLNGFSRLTGSLLPGGEQERGGQECGGHMRCFTAG